MWIDWRWIWQRPQILAYKLGEEYDVTVAFPQNVISRQRMQKANVYPKKYKKIYVVPLYNKIAVLQKLMNLVIKYTLGDIKKYDAVWVGHPLFEKFIPEDYSGKIIYDCMDNHAALSDSEENGKKAQEAEKRLVKRADIVFATAELLKEKMETFAAGTIAKVFLVRNGYAQKKIYEPALSQSKDRYRLAYIGTISEWMDYSVITQSIEDYDNIEYHLIGLVSNNCYVKNERLHYEGVVEHKELYDTIKNYDCLVMPFLVNEIVLSVDPVKLYEYISFGKCIISVYYPEIERFCDYVYFYRTKEEYVELINELIQKGFPPKYTKEEQVKFLENNTWDKRFEIIKSVIED